MHGMPPLLDADDFLDKCRAYSDLARHRDALAQSLAGCEGADEDRRVDLEDALEDNRAARLVLMWKILEGDAQLSS